MHTSIGPDQVGGKTINMGARGQEFLSEVGRADLVGM